MYNTVILNVAVTEEDNTESFFETPATPFTYQNAKLFAVETSDGYMIKEFYSGWSIGSSIGNTIEEALQKDLIVIKKKGGVGRCLNQMIKNRIAITKPKPKTLNKRFLKKWEANNEIIFEVNDENTELSG